MISSGVFILMLVGIAFVVLALLFIAIRLLMPSSKPSTAGTIGLIAGIVVAIVINSMASRAIIVAEDLSYSTKYFFGSSFSLDGNSVEKPAGMKTAIVNQSQDTLLVEYVVYGSSYGGGDETQFVGVGETVWISDSGIDYGPNESAPETISSKSGSETRIWVRTLDSFLAEYGDELEEEYSSEYEEEYDAELDSLGEAEMEMETEAGVE